MKKVTMLVAISMMVTGCATGKWIKPGAPESDFYKNKIDCQIKAKALTMTEEEGFSKVLKINSIMKQCMIGEGYQYVSQ